MDWSGREQLQLLLESMVPGMLIGACFDCDNGLFHKQTSFWRTLILDGLWGCIAALVTFFTALVLADGQLHPVLLLGILLGFLIERYTIGRFVCLCARKTYHYAHTLRAWIGSFLRGLWIKSFAHRKK